MCGEIASGSTATVFLAEDRILRRKVALKKLHPHLLNHPETVTRFQKEAVAVASLSHENIIRLYDFGNEARNLFLAMEYVDGPSLEGLLADHAPLPGRVCLTLMSQVLRGLAAAHEAGIIHRDIKPSNLLVDSRGKVRLADFGIAFLAEEAHITKTGSYLGTPVYSAPEQAKGLPATAKSDIFSAGILFFRCLTGRLPFVGDSPQAVLTAILERAPARPMLINRRVLPGLSELVDRMLAKDPLKRPSAAGCLAELEAVAARHGFPIDPDRLRRFAADPASYAAEEMREVAAHFLDQARAAEAGGQARAAAKLAALAELYCDPVVEPPTEIGRIHAHWAARARRRVLALAALALLGTAAAWFGLAGSIAPGGQTASTPAAAGPAIPAKAVATPAPPSPLLVSNRTTKVTHVEAALADAAKAPIPAATPARPRRVSQPPMLPIAAPIAERAAEAPAEIPAPPSGRLLVKSNPPFARVHLAERELGTTPFKAPVEVPAGTHEILLERAGCLPLRAQVKVESGALAEVRLILDKAQSASR